MKGNVVNVKIDHLTLAKSLLTPITCSKQTAEQLDLDSGGARTYL